MTAEAAQSEPTMEEILASIRKIISEDDQPGEALELTPAEAPAEPEPVQDVVFDDPEPQEEIEAEPEAPELVAEEDLVIMEREEPEADEEPAFAEALEPEPQIAAPVSRPAPAQDDRLVEQPAAEQAAGALGKLMGSMMISQGQTLDGVVRELLKPMLKDWLNARLPQIVESEVQKEIERIRRMAQ